ncbi:MAG: hypothetical protein QXQ94_07215 [Candidatus Bathyarchaeia archaeon]
MSKKLFAFGKFLLKCFVRAQIIVLIDFFIVLLNLFRTLSVLIWIESSVFFIAAGLIGTYSSVSVGKFKELAFNSEAWTFEEWKKSLKQADVILCVGVILLVEAIIFSLTFNI